MVVKTDLRLEDILRIHGINVIGCWQTLNSRDKKWDKLSEVLLEEALQDPISFARFTSLCRAVTNKNLFTADIQKKTLPEYRLAQLITDFGFASIDSSRGNDSFRLILKDPETVTFLSGAWLENLVMMATEKLKDNGLIQDAACGIKLNIGSEVHNEFDGMILSNGKVFAIECKAKKPRGKSGILGIGQEAIYKIDSICSIRDFKATPILVTLAKPDYSEELRMNVEKIHHISGDSLRLIPSKLSEIVSFKDN